MTTTATGLLGRILRPGSGAAQRELVEALSAHAGLVLQSAARVLGSLADAEDVAQDIAEKLLRSPPREVRSWPGLLRTMAVNRSIDRLRRRREPPEAPDEGPIEPDEALVQRQRAEALRCAIAELPPRDATMFSLHYFGDLTYGEIGEQLDMTANAVGVAMHRLRRRLAETIEQRLAAAPAADATNDDPIRS